jgi:DNA polymerase-1
LRDINSRNAIVRGHAERNAINAPIQGTAADMIKIAMVNIHQEMAKTGIRSQLIMQVHDELVFEVHKDELEELSSLVESQMKNAIPMKVPIEIDLGTGKNWLAAH